MIIAAERAPLTPLQWMGGFLIIVLVAVIFRKR